MGELTVAPSVGELITTSADEVGAGGAGGLAVDDPAVELPAFVAVPVEVPPKPVPGAAEAPVPVLVALVAVEPTEDTLAFVELSGFV